MDTAAEVAHIEPLLTWRAVWCSLPLSPAFGRDPGRCTAFIVAEVPREPAAVDAGAKEHVCGAGRQDLHANPNGCH